MAWRGAEGWDALRVASYELRAAGVSRIWCRRRVSPFLPRFAFSLYWVTDFELGCVAVLFNVSQLVREPVGATRQFALGAEAPVHRGRVALTHTPGGVLVQAEVEVVLEAVCSRCLVPFGYSVPLAFEEIYHQQLDVETGARLAAPEDPESFLVSADHMIDITEAVRQYGEVAVAMQPLCRPDCPGICPVCGQDLSIGACECDRSFVDPRWAALARLKLLANG